MCTVTIVADDHGCRVMSNRDERRDRAALEPQIERLGPRLAIMPIDPVAGGSWIGVNDAGLVATLLNRYGVRSPLPDGGRLGGAPTSRGLIVRHALGSESIGHALESMRRLDATRFQPFRLVLVHKRRIGVVLGDGRGFASAESPLEQPHMFTSSALGDVFVDGPRRRLFECLMDHADGHRHGQLLFHRHQWSDKREISVLMERHDAATVSRTTVEIKGRAGVLEYDSLTPCRPVQRVEL